MDRTEANKMDAVTRREFVKKSSLALGSAAVTQFPHVITAHAAPDDPTLVGLVGCGGRGTGAALNIVILHRYMSGDVMGEKGDF